MPSEPRAYSAVRWGGPRLLLVLTVGLALNGCGANNGAESTTPGGEGGGAGQSAAGGTGNVGVQAGSGGAQASGGGRAGAASGGAVGQAGSGASGGALGSAGAGGAGVTDCSAPAPGSALVGWAAVSGGGVATTTGGGAAAPITVTTLAALNAAASGSNAAVIWVSGTLTGDIKIGSNKTIAGICGAALHGHIEISGSQNVILQNLAVVGYGVGNCALDPNYDSSVGCSSGLDAISVINSAHHIWVDHCDISDGTDGNLDITLGSDFVTVSWTKFHYTPRTDNTGNDSTGGSGHRFSNLVGGMDNSAVDVGKLNVTWHHDWWADNAVERMPRVRYGKNHLFNNLWSSKTAAYCVRAGTNAQILIEQAVFNGVSNPQEFNTAADQATSFITATNDVYTTTSGSRSTGGGGTAFTTPPYAYTPDPTSTLQAAIQSGAGPH